MLDVPKPAALDHWSPESFAVALADLLIKQGKLDDKSLDRGRRLAEESGTRLDAVLTQLGLISERGLAEAMAILLGLDIAAPTVYVDTAILPDKLRPKFLRNVRAL